eukprot:scaffold569_cov408-Prasinococcus_capsulatus_cf.AAC.22
MTRRDSHAIQANEAQLVNGLVASCNDLYNTVHNERVSTLRCDIYLVVTTSTCRSTDMDDLANQPHGNHSPLNVEQAMKSWHKTQKMTADALASV